MASDAYFERRRQKRAVKSKALAAQRKAEKLAAEKRHYDEVARNATVAREEVKMTVDEFLKKARQK